LSNAHGFDRKDDTSAKYIHDRKRSSLTIFDGRLFSIKGKPRQRKCEKTYNEKWVKNVIHAALARRKTTQRHISIII
jgi:hypothetical protein